MRPLKCLAAFTGMFLAGSAAHAQTITSTHNLERFSSTVSSSAGVWHMPQTGQDQEYRLSWMGEGVARYRICNADEGKIAGKSETQSTGVEVIVGEGENATRLGTINRTSCMDVVAGKIRLVRTKAEASEGPAFGLYWYLGD